jgi:glycosyltransferase involved in cell wall biosynthesis
LAEPRKLYEYMAAGLPVVAADLPTVRAVVTKTDCGLLVDPNSINDIAAALTRMASDPGMRARMAENGRSAIRTKLNWSVEKPKFQALFSNEISQESRGLAARG